VSLRVVYDTMVFFQWAALPEDRQHTTIRALYDGSVRLSMSRALFEEVRDVLSRPEVQARAPSLTPERLKQILSATLEHAEWLPDVPNAFTWTQHPDDDHIFNLAIAAHAQYLVTWESRIHKLASDTTPDAERLRILAPQLEIITPKQFAERLKTG
jgi:putative PIN family toxin of toxin-antitoxin system